MKKILAIICLATTAIFSSTNKVKASHAVGADLTYTYVSPNVIHLKLRFYRDCSGIPAPTTGNVSFSSASCGQPSFTVNMPLISTVEIITSDCIDTTAQTTCHPGGTRYGVEEYIFEMDVTLPAGCTDWVIEFEECCRNNNQTMTGNPYLFVSTTLDNLNYPTNNSPQFLSYPATSFCVGNPFYYKQDAWDPDGDSLVYSLVAAQGAGGGLVNYIFPYTGSYPIASSTGITIDQTGQIFLTPSMIQTAVICVLVEEFRNGIKIGEVKRDIQVKVEALCDPNLTPKYNVLADTVGINVACGTFAFDIPFRRDVQCGSIVNDDFRVLNSLGFPIPIVSIVGYNCFGGLTDSIRVTLSEPFTWGTNYIWTKTGSDGNTILGKCGFGSTTFDTLRYIVDDPSPYARVTDSIGCTLNSFTTTLSEYVYCYTVDQDASSLQLVDAGNGNALLPITSTYAYCGPSGDSLSNQILINFTSQQTPAGPVYLIAKTGTDGNTIANSCGRFLADGDTMAEFFINNVIPLTLGNDIDACTNTNEIPVNLNSGLTTAGGLTFQWYLNGAAITGETNPTYAATASGIYGVIASATVFCRGSDSVDINVMNTPVVSFGLDTNICSGDSVVLDMTSSNGMIYQWYVNGLANNADTLPTYTVTTNAQYVGASIIYSVNNHFCFGADTILVYTWPTPTVTMSDNTVCSNTLPFLIDAGIPTPATYLWSNGATSSSINVNAGGTYSVTVTGFPSCVVEDSMILTVLQSPTATLPPAVTQCANIPLQPLDPGFPGALSYAWTDQNNQPLASTQTFTPPATVGTNTYTVVVSNGTCSATAQTVVTLNAIPVVNATSPDSICELDPPATLSANYPPGSNISYLWSTGAVTETISTSTANTYTVTVTENGCSASDVVSLSVQQQLTAPILACGVAASGSFKIVYTWSDVPGNTGYEVSPDGINWGPANNVSGATSHGTNTISPYFYVRALMNGTACDYGKTSEPVACAVIIPSIVTPNGDGQNDAFLIDNIGFYPDNTFKIFNRWGKEVYSEGGYNNTTKVFTGNDLPEGTYFYILDLGNGGDPASGTLTISK